MTGIGLLLVMPVALSHTMELNQEKTFAHDTGESLALVDVETYPAFVGKKADRLDMMAFFCANAGAHDSFVEGSRDGAAFSRAPDRR